MKNQFLYFLVLILIFTACKKGEVSYVKGTVTETGSNAPLEGVDVTLCKSTTKHDIVVESAKTNSEGKYILSYNKIPGGEYTVKCSYNGYFLEENCIGKDLDKDKEAINFVMFPVAYVKFRFIKTTASSNSIHGRFWNENHPTNWFYPSVQYSFPFQAFDNISSEINHVYGNAYLNIEWGDYDMAASAVTPSFTNLDRFFIPKGDTLIYTITFN
jgi:5-hydroxyisourate hydrolase-like protein (transthyretin family)